MSFLKCSLLALALLLGNIAPAAVPPTRRLRNAPLRRHRPASRGSRRLFGIPGGDMLKQWLKPTGTKAGLMAMLAGYYFWNQHRKDEVDNIRDLKQRLTMQNIAFQSSQGQRNELLRHIDSQMNLLTGRLDSLRRVVGDKIEQFEGYVKARLGGLSASAFKETYGRPSY